MHHRFFDTFLSDPNGKPGLGFIGFGGLLNIIHQWSREDWSFYLSMISVSLGIIYYVLKIITEFIKKQKS